MSGAPRIVVVGGGLSGLATAWYLRRDHPEADVTVLEASDRLGGKLFTGELAGGPFDLGADAFLFRQPEFAELCEDLGLGDDLVAPATGQVWLWLGEELRPLPSGTVLGVPGDLDALERARVLSPEGLERASEEAYLAPPSLAPDADPTIAEFVASRFGPEVVERLVDPLLSGVYAGDTGRLGLRSAAPAIAQVVDQARDERTSMLEVLRKRAIASRPDARPVFKTVRGGLGRVIDALAADLEVRTGRAVEHVDHAHGDWQVDGEPADAVVLAAPTWQTTRVVSRGIPRLSGMLDRISYGGATVIALAYPAGTELPEGSGMLVPRVSDRLLKASTWSSRKWPHVAERDEVLLRCSTGRVNDHRHDLLGDDELVQRTHEELAEALGITEGPIDARVQRWTRGLPQYDSGHLARVAEIRHAARQAGIVVTGAAFDGVGLPACVRQARVAAEEAWAIATS